MGACDRSDFQLLRPIATEHDPILSQSRARSDGAWRLHFDTLDRANDFWPIEDICYDRECSCRPRSYGLCKLDLHGSLSSEPTSGPRLTHAGPRGVPRP